MYLILLLSLPLPSHHASFTLKSTLFFFSNLFLLSLFYPTSAFSGLPTMLTVFISLSFSLFNIIHLHLIHFMPVSVNKPPTVLALWQALYRHSKSPSHLHYFHFMSMWGNYYWRPRLVFSQNISLTQQTTQCCMDVQHCGPFQNLVKLMERGQTCENFHTLMTAGSLELATMKIINWCRTW